MSKILIVDDSAVNLKIISGFLGNEYEVIIASDGHTAIQLAIDKKPDLILLDVVMPGIDGFHVCRVLKSQLATAEIPIIFITVLTEPKDIAKAFEAGGQDYVIKPFSPLELCARVKTHLELRESREALKAYNKQLEAKNHELTEALAKMEVLAITDHLTKLPNRRYMMQKLSEEVARLQRKPGNTTLILADVDNFKSINDNYGHDCGDLVIKTIASIMKATIREQDLIARWGGDEFLLMLPDTDDNGGRVVAEKLQQAIGAAAIPYRGEELAVTITLGMAKVELKMDIDANIKRADEDLYKGKKCIGITGNGVNNV